MYIVAIGWMYVVVLMAATEHSFAAGLATFLFYGLLPCSVLMYLLGTKSRRARKRALEEAEQGLPSDPQAAPAVAPADEKTSVGP
ncbi:MAG TPA: hypothetical protein VFV57_07960 [Limnobacter sp.]|nr:hypothetical protein [Limnobacter sp.]